jgi:hypothetical protein
VGKRQSQVTKKEALMAMRKKIGTGEVKAKFAFIAVEPTKLTEKHLYAILRNSMLWERERINEGEITEFVAFVESGKSPLALPLRHSTNEFAVDGTLAFTTTEVVEDTIREKLFHQSSAFRQLGKKSTHPPQWLLTTTLVLIIGDTRFLMSNADLYLEREGLLRMELIEILKELATLKPRMTSKENDYYSVDVAHRGFYRGYVEELGRVVGIRPHDEEDIMLSTEHFLRKFTQEE